MDQELAGTMYFDEDLMGLLEAAHQDPALSADELREGVVDIITTALQPWSRRFVAELKKQVLTQAAAAYEKEGNRRAFSKRTLTDHMDGLDIITDGIVETSMEIYEAANPIGSKRRAVIETFESEVEKASELLVRKANQEKARDKQQKRVSAFKAALDGLGDPGSENEYEHTSKSVDAAQTRRGRCDREVNVARSRH